MRFKLDENLSEETVDLLLNAGHDVTTVLEQGLSGEPDRSVMTVCRQESRALITLDTDFADIRAYPPDAYPGLLVLRLRRQDKTYVLNVLRRVLPLLKKEQLSGRLWIVDEERVRVRS